MTHIENIPHILEHGITHHRSPNSNKKYVSIGYSNLISKREGFTLPNGNALGNYIPFYFGARMPMLYVIMLGSNSTQYDMKSLSSEKIVYCITTINQIQAHDLNFIFSDGHAVSILTEFFDKDNIDNIFHLLDWSAIKATYWNDENDLDLKRRKEAEFLVEGDIPANCILGFGVYNDYAKGMLIEYGIPENKIAIKPDYYFNK